MRRMKVLFVSDARSTHTEKWVNALSKREIEVHLVYFKGHTSSNVSISKKVIKYELPHSFSRFPLRNAIKLRKLFSKIQPDVVNVHNASGYGWLINLSGIRPYIINVWGSDLSVFPYKSPIHKLILTKNLDNASMVLSTSKYMKQQVIDLLKNNYQNNIHVIPFGVDVDLFKRKDIRINDNSKIVIGNIKSFKPHYGIEYLIEAIGSIRNTLLERNQVEIFQSISVVIYGSGTKQDVENIQMIVDDLNLNETIKLNGPIPNSQVPSILEEFDIFCATSIRESFGVSLVEAMSMELPVVATKNDGFIEVVDDNITGILVENEDYESIAHGLLELIYDKNKRLEFGKNGRQKVVNEFNLGDNTDELIKKYSIVLKSKQKLERF